nr:hypothetical protein [uncultured Blautia sp.]
MLYWGGRMDFLLNEQSLQGQFKNVEEFLESIKPVIQCINIIHECPEVSIYKTMNFNERKITENERICDLARGQVSDELLHLQLSLDNEIYSRPFWDDNPEQDLDLEYLCEGENVSCTSLSEAAVRKDALLSFALERFMDCVIVITSKEKTYSIPSVHTPKYLVEQYKNVLKIDRTTILKTKYDGTRVDCTTLETEYGADILEEKEFKMLISTLDKIVEHDSWESIGRDDGLEYKKYTPSPKNNWFRDGKYRGKTIMKFRYSKVMRCFGYRKGDKLRLLRLERDHSISDNG